MRTLPQAGLGTGTGASTISFQTGTTLTTGLTLQTMSTKMTILGNGNVGIGTTTPDKLLHVYSATNEAVLRISSGVNENNSLELGEGNNLWQWSKRSSAESDRLDLYRYNGSWSAYITVLTNGNVGIRTTSPTELLSLGTAGTTKGVLSLAGVTSGKIIVQPANAAGTWTMTLPTAVGGAGEQLTDVAGNGITSWAAASSSRQSKDIIGTITDPSEALTQILSTPIYRFNYKPGMGTGDSTTEYVGVMANEALWAMHFNGTIVNPVNTLGYMVLGIQATNKKISDLTLIVTDNFVKQTSVNETLLASIQELDLKISDLSTTQIGTPATTLGQYASMFFSDVVYSVENGIAYMKALVVDTLKIGSPDKRTGITLYDEISGEPYCISVANGETKTTAGECVVIERSVADVDEPVDDNPQDTTPPVITLNGSSEVNLDINDTYTEEGATAVDNVDGDVAIIISGSVDTLTDGIYTITYTATDTADNTATATRTVNVGDVVVTPEPTPEPEPEPDTFLSWSG
ncbi:MAG: Lipoprotein [Candidatus Nomurabacteria bacterium GW2011_GWA2_35_80]|uniref:Lipoprotein n=1 Tax=Candidatus Nomurabacteria bacterium GW2011_GWA2_35_80 TaxID=1618733 RepID=A0A0G0FKS8_9BACT|nr:MAG: Lipoprotein [Candidatus Nomurabacteria bacterium GW2011_GWA2_35_80]